MLKLWQGSTIELTPHFEIAPKTFCEQLAKNAFSNENGF